MEDSDYEVLSWTISVNFKIDPKNFWPSVAPPLPVVTTVGAQSAGHTLKATFYVLPMCCHCCCHWQKLQGQQLETGVPISEAHSGPAKSYFLSLITFWWRTCPSPKLVGTYWAFLCSDADSGKLALLRPWLAITLLWSLWSRLHTVSLLLMIGETLRCFKVVQQVVDS